jgi:GT2 family glycosyltransferase
MIRSTILLPNYNNERVLPVMFESLRSNVDCASVNFVVVDDGSEDDGVKVLKREIDQSNFAKAEIIVRKHQGIAPTLNAGLEAIATPYVLRIDGDATVETLGWTRIMERWLDTYPALGMVGSHVIFDSGKVHSFGRSVINELGLYDMGCIPAEPIGHRTFDSHVIRPQSGFSSQPAYEVDTLLGVCAAFHLSDAKAVGGFDKSYDPVWIEDDDFGLSIRLMGKKIIVDPSIHVVHRVSLRGSRQPNSQGTEKNDLIKTPSAPGKMVSNFFSWRTKVAARDSVPGRKIHSNDGTEWFGRESNPWRIEILQKHYKLWKTKWGFDVLNPDLNDIFERYWDTEICWKCNPSLYADSKQSNWIV